MPTPPPGFSDLLKIAGVQLGLLLTVAGIVVGGTGDYGQARIREQGRAAGAVGGLLSQHKSTNQR